MCDEKIRIKIKNKKMDNKNKKKQQLKDVFLVVIKPHVQDIIAHLMKNDAFTQSQSDLAKASQTFVGILQIDLAKLKKYGILEENRDGRTVYYNLNKEKILPLISIIETITKMIEE